MSKKVAIVYATNKGKTELVAGEIAKKIVGAQVFNIAETEVSALKDFDYLILGTSSIGHGEMQKPWKLKIDELAAMDFSGKTVAFFGLGNALYHGDTFSQGVSHLYEALKGKVAIEGATSTEGYKFDTTNSFVDGKFIGLIIDQDNESDKTEGRIDEWVKTLSL